MPPESVLGADFECENFIRGLERPGGTGYEASRALLLEIDGVPASRRTAGFDVQDQGRLFLPENGGSVYIDLNHLEACVPEVRSGRDFVAAFHAMVRIVRGALARANRKLPEGQRIELILNNSDGLGNSYGSHLNFLTSRDVWERVVRTSPEALFFLASHQASSVIYTGQGKVGSENGRPGVAFQLSQRADFMETLCGAQTTYRRPIVNARDESLCRGHADLARLHCIFFDNGLCHVATALKVGTMQIVLALLEDGVLLPDALVRDPIHAVVAWSHDPSLRTRVPMLAGGSASALDVQRRLHDFARTHHEKRGLPGVADADALLEMWGDTLDRLAEGSLESLVGRLDWATKRHALEQALVRGSLDWDAPEIRHLDQVYAHVDPERGLYWSYEARGLVETLVDEEAIDRFTREPPHDTRAYARASLLRRFDRDEIVEVDWDHVTVQLGEGRSRHVVTVELGDPLGTTAPAPFGRNPLSNPEKEES